MVVTEGGTPDNANRQLAMRWAGTPQGNSTYKLDKLSRAIKLQDGANGRRIVERVRGDGQNDLRSCDNLGEDHFGDESTQLGLAPAKPFL